MLTLPETIKLFDSDAYAADFTASVLSAELIEKKKIHFRKEAYYHTTLHKYYLKEIPNIKYPEKKKNIINASIRYLITKNATTLLKYVSKDPPFKNAEFNQEIDYNKVYFRDSRYSIRKKFINL